jgi:hypothetical protein
MPGARDPDRPSGISPCRSLRAMFVFSVSCLVSRQCHKISPIGSTCDSSVKASRTLTLSPSALMPLTRLNRFRVMRHPSGLLDSLCTLHLSCSRLQQYLYHSQRSARGATLDTGGWLALTRPGLSPGKKRQASLGALTYSVNRRPARTSQQPQRCAPGPSCRTFRGRAAPVR